MNHYMGIGFLLVLAIIFWIFKPYKLIAGMTFCTKEEIEKYNTDKMCKILSIFLIILALILEIVPLLTKSPIAPLMFVIPLTIGFIIILNSKIVLK